MLAGVSGPKVSSSDGSLGGSSEVGGSSSVPGGGGDGRNRWPREETLALIRIRSEMDSTFKESSLKAPLWEEVSRKLSSLGFQRSAKKCKEKFENVYKYQKRTKDGQSAKSDGKSYSFFDQLEALENFPLPAAMAPPHVTVPSISPTPLSVIHPTTNPQLSSPQLQQAQLIPPTAIFRSDSTSSSTSSDEGIRRRQRRRGKHQKWKDYVERLIKELVEKQEALQKKFLEALENRERDRTAREEAWRVQETTRIKREHEILVRERAMASAKDAALIAFLQKVNDQHAPQFPIGTNPSTPLPPVQTPPPEVPKVENGSRERVFPGSSSRWPKAEIQALIDVRTGLDLKYHENGPKGPLWEEVSTEIAKMGYNRSSKRCKEKWENINKYYKKVKESNKKIPEGSKTCPYFHQLEAIYNERAKHGASLFDRAYATNPMEPILARPEQQWSFQKQDSVMHDQDQDNDDSHENNQVESKNDKGEEGEEYELQASKQLPTVEDTFEKVD